MKTNIKDFQRKLAQIPEMIALEVQAALAVVANKIAEDAKAMIGNEQADWPPLADSTIQDKERKGFEVPKPLLRTGEMRDSIQVHVEGNTAVIGTNNEYAVYQEGGTDKIPPRPFLSKSAVHNMDVIEVEFLAALEKAFK
jgi:HK97 gp10 family phage protein